MYSPLGRELIVYSPLLFDKAQFTNSKSSPTTLSAQATAPGSGAPPAAAVMRPAICPPSESDALMPPLGPGAETPTASASAKDALPLKYWVRWLPPPCPNNEENSTL